MLVTNRLRLTCETGIETLADCPNIAIVGETDCHADIGGGKSNRGIASRFSL